MANSLRAKLSKLRHDGHITDAEYQAFIKKLDGHDAEVYNRGYAEGKKRQLIAEIKIDKDMMQEMLDEKIKEFEVDIQETRNKAIDEFAEKIAFEISESIIFGFIVDSDKVGNFDNASDKIVDYVIDISRKIAEQMKKEGAE